MLRSLDKEIEARFRHRPVSYANPAAGSHSWKKRKGNGNKMAQEKNSYEKIYEVVRQIPKGCVATYGQVAALAGNCRWARVVGYALHVNPDPEGIPCYRVVNREGRLSDAFAFGGVNRQKLLLEEEGITVHENHVDLSTFQWKKSVF